MKKQHLMILRDIGIMLVFIAGATILGGLFFSWNHQNINVVFAYLLAVLLTARYTSGYMEGILASILSLLAFNWFFTEPYFTLKVNDLTYIITFFIMMITATLTSALTTKFKKAAAEAKEKEEESNALYQMTNHLTDAEDIEAIARITVHTVSRILGCNVGCMCFDEKGKVGTTFIQQKVDGSIVRREVNDGEKLIKKMENLHTAFDVGAEFCDWPIYGRNMILGILRIPTDKMEEIGREQNRLIFAVLESCALAMERYRSMEEQARSRQEVEKERYRSNLLRAISHDIRTPLTGIMGSSEMLMNVLEEGEFSYELAEGIYKDADWLHSLVENILNLTRLQDGKAPLVKQPEAVEEVIGSAIHVMEKRVPGIEIQVDMPDLILIIPMNARLIHQVLVNLMDNAAAHSPDNIQIQITVHVHEEEKTAEFIVADNGTGIPEEDLGKIFEMFYTTDRKIADSRRGVGLGLAICQSIIEAHGGTIKAGNRKDKKGAEFIFTLPIEGEDE